jgi:hypothetical protein
MARRRREYDKRGPDLSSPLQDKLDTFGQSANPYWVPISPRFAGLIGEHTSRFRIADGDCAVAVDYLSDFSRMDRDAAVVPFEFAGQFKGRLPPEGPPFLAVSINGTVRAVTRGWRAAPRHWLATLRSMHGATARMPPRCSGSRRRRARRCCAAVPFARVVHGDCRPGRQSVHRTGPRAARVATPATGARGARRVPAGCPDREGGQRLFQVRALARRALRRLLPPDQHLEPGPALAARILVNRHATIIAGRDFLCETT